VIDNQNVVHSDKLLYAIYSNTSGLRKIELAPSQQVGLHRHSEVGNKCASGRSGTWFTDAVNKDASSADQDLGLQVQTGFTVNNVGERVSLSYATAGTPCSMPDQIRRMGIWAVEGIGMRLRSTAKDLPACVCQFPSCPDGLLLPSFSGSQWHVVRQATDQCE
jgi:hypothetical protein